MTEELQRESLEWSANVRRILREIREVRLGTLDQAATPELDRSVIARAESGRTKNLYWHQVYAIAKRLDIDPRMLMALDPRVTKSHWPPAALDVEDWGWVARVNLRSWRGGMGTPTLAGLADMHQSSIVRIESGEYAQLDLVRLFRAFKALGHDIVQAFELPPEECADERREEPAGESR